MTAKKNRFAQFASAKPSYNSSETAETAPELVKDTTVQPEPEIAETAPEPTKDTTIQPETEQSSNPESLANAKTSVPKSIKKRGKEKNQPIETAEYTTAKVNTAIHKLIKKNVYFNPEYGATIQEFVENAITHYDAFITKKVAK